LQVGFTGGCITAETVVANDRHACRNPYCNCATLRALLARSQRGCSCASVQLHDWLDQPQRLHNGQQMGMSSDTKNQAAELRGGASDSGAATQRFLAPSSLPNEYVRANKPVQLSALLQRSPTLPSRPRSSSSSSTHHLPEFGCNFDWACPTAAAMHRHCMQHSYNGSHTPGWGSARTQVRRQPLAGARPVPTQRRAHDLPRRVYAVVILNAASRQSERKVRGRGRGARGRCGGPATAASAPRHCRPWHQCPAAAAAASKVCL
jgi:hypothetical protein